MRDYPITKSRNFKTLLLAMLAFTLALSTNYPEIAQDQITESTWLGTSGAPVIIDDDTGTVSETAPDGTLVVDLDSTDDSLVTNWTITSQPYGAFAIDSTGVITVSDSSNIDYEMSTTHVLEVTIYYTGGNSSESIIIQVTDVQPYIANIGSSTPVTISDEHGWNGTFTIELEAGGDDTSLTWMIVDGNLDGDYDGNHPFAISASSSEGGTAVITVNDPDDLDYETTASYNLTIQVNDGIWAVNEIITILVWSPYTADGNTAATSQSEYNMKGFQEGSIFTESRASLGDYHSCVITDYGSIECWGKNTHGQLGDGTTTNRLMPTPTQSLGNYTATAVAAGGSHTCAILNDGSVICWGSGSFGGTPANATQISLGASAVSISAGPSQTCAILDNGTISCWSTDASPALVPLGTGHSAVAVSTGGHSCAILDDGTVSCWGDNFYGQLGDGTTTDRNTPTPTASLGQGRTAVAISAGGEHTCAVLDNGGLSCWGRTDIGQVGVGIDPAEGQHTPLSHPYGEQNYTGISLGDAHSCGLRSDGTVTCWGEYNYGQIGDGSGGSAVSPVQTSWLGNGSAVALIAGRSHTCAILDDDSVSCWGRGDYGQIGDGASEHRSMPTPISLSSDGVGVLASERDPDSDGALSIFDTHMKGAQGDSVHTISTIGVGLTHQCMLLEDGEVACWGDNNYGQLGDGTTGGSTTPVAVVMPANRIATSISSGRWHTCAILDDGSVSCWGRGSDGQLGDGTATHQNTPSPVSLPAGRTADAITGGRFHTCAILDDGSLWCWGQNNYYQLGDGTSISRPSPVNSPLPSGRTAIGVAAGDTYTCVILDDGSVRCWGYNNNGQLGTGTNTHSFSNKVEPQLPSGSRAVSIGIEDVHTCVILDDGSVWCWGYNMEGQIGNGNSGSDIWNALSPTQVSLPEGRTAELLSVGRYHTCVVLAANSTDNGSTVCWGNHNPNNSGMVSSGGIDFPPSNTPVYANVSDNVVAIRSGMQYSTCYVFSNGTASCAYRGWSSSGGPNIIIPDFSNLSSGPEIGDIDSDGDGVHDLFDEFPENPSRARECDPGYYGRYACNEASKGYYVEHGSSIHQSACPAGTYNPYTAATNGSTACLAPQPGYYSASVAAPAQTLCPAGTYQPNSGQSSCFDASPGHYAPDQFETVSNQYGPPMSVSCIILDTSEVGGDLYCWNDGQLVATPMPAGRAAISVSSDDGHQCAIMDDGSLYCWGSNDHGQLGIGNTIDQSAPANVPNPGGPNASFTQVSAGPRHTCAIIDDGRAYCWGANEYGQLGIGGAAPNGGSGNTVSDTYTPTQVVFPDGGNVTSISLGNRHTCAVVDGSAYCWGIGGMSGGEGLLGIGEQPDDYTSPSAKVTCDNSRSNCPENIFAGNVASISVGISHTCMIVESLSSIEPDPTGLPDNRSVWCWGPSNSVGGSDDCNDSDWPSSGSGYNGICYFPVIVENLSQVVQLSADGGDTCSVITEGVGETHYPYCWGGGSHPTLRSTPITPNSSSISWMYVSGSYLLSGDGSLFEWGVSGYNVVRTPLAAMTTQNSLQPVPRTQDTPCSIGTYQPSAGQSSCLGASPGHYVPATGQVSMTPCVAGTYNPNSSSISSSDCILAPPGKYSGAGASSPTQCSPGTYQPNAGQISCIDAGAGHYVSTVGQSTQTECSAGTYQWATGQTS
ncbi:MAG: hypothetical protein ACPGN8_06730, partial [Candidatus Thalassarchaeaceae archaeon]